MGASISHRAIGSVIAAVAAAVGIALILAAPASADTTFGTFGSGAGETNNPAGIAVDFADGTVYVADRSNNRISVFASDGTFIRAFGWGVDTGAAALETCTTASGCQAGIPGSGGGQLSSPRGVAVDNDPASPNYRDVYVAERNNERVQRFDPTGAFELAFGDGVNETTGGDVCTAVSGDTCGAGTPGTGAGQFADSSGVTGDEQLAVGPGGAVYVADDDAVGNDDNIVRVQTFDPGGVHIALFNLTVITGGEHHFPIRGLAVDSGGDFYAASANHFSKHDGATGAELAAPDPIADASLSLFGPMAFDVAGNLFVNANGTLHYSPAGVLQRVIYASDNAKGLAAHSTADGDLYVSRGGQASRIEYLSFPPPGPAVVPNGTEASGVGNLAATLSTEVNPEGEETTVRFEYVDEESYETEGGFSSPDTQTTPESAPIGSDFKPYVHSFVIPCAGPGEPGCLDAETTYRFRAVATNADAPAGNPGPEATFTTLPSIELGDVWSTGVGVSDASLHFSLDPLAVAATGYFEYVSEAEFQAAGFDEAVAVPDVPGGAGPLDFGSGTGQVARKATVGGLEADTTYRYRFIASNFFGEFVGDQGSFHTFSPNPQPNTDCPNQEFRTGPSERLADCRAYELVSPLEDRNNANIVTAGTLTQGRPGSYYQAAVGGNAVTYTSDAAFAGAESAPRINHYLSQRDPQAGWLTHSLNPPYGTSVTIGIPAIFNNQRAFSRIYSPDLSTAWIYDYSDPPLDPAAAPGYANLYRRDSDGSYVAQTTVVPSGQVASSYHPRTQGTSADGSRFVFRANGRLTASASPAMIDGSPIFQLYERHPGGLRLVSVLPDGSTNDGHSTAGSGIGGTLQRAVSDDGSRIFWTAISGPSVSEPDGRIYARLDGTTTIEVSESVSAAEAVYWGADPAGDTVLFTIDDGASPGDELYSFDVETETPTLIASGVLGVAGFSEDLSRIYLVSSEVLDPETNPEGDPPVAGEPNLYLHEGGGFEFVGTLSGAVGGDQTVWGTARENRPARSSTAGSKLAFTSRAPLTDYDNAHAENGELTAEVFVYDAEANAGEGKLYCASCNPGGGRPAAGTPAEQGNAAAGSSGQNIAAWIRRGPSQGYHHLQRFLTDDGNRLYFEAFDSLLPLDTNGAMDIYQWETPGSGDCTTQHAHYFEENGGCISLISTGKSPADSFFVDADPTGENVFFRTGESLLPNDPDLIDVYVARVGGGFPPPPEPPVPCEGDGCQPPASDPELDDPGSEGFEGAEDPAVPADCRSAARKATKAEKQAERAKRKAKKAKRKAKRASGRRAKRLRRQAKQRRKAAKRAKRKAARLGRSAERCRAGSGGASAAAAGGESR